MIHSPLPLCVLAASALLVSACATTQPEHPSAPPSFSTAPIQPHFGPVTSPLLRDVQSVDVFQVGQDVRRAYDVVATARKDVALVRFNNTTHNSTARQEQEALLELRRVAASRDADAVIVRLRDEELLADASDVEYNRRSVRRYYEASLIRYRTEG